MASRAQPALLRGDESPSKCKASKKHKDKKRKKDKDRGGVSKSKAPAGGTTVERLRAERREREAAERIRQQRVLQQPLARCVPRTACRSPRIFIAHFVHLRQQPLVRSLARQVV